MYQMLAWNITGIYNWRHLQAHKQWPGFCYIMASGFFCINGYWPNTALATKEREVLAETQSCTVALELHKPEFACCMCTRNSKPQLANVKFPTFQRNMASAMWSERKMSMQRRSLISLLLSCGIIMHSEKVVTGRYFTSYSL